MAAVSSNMLILNTLAPEFNLFNPILNKHQSLTELKSEKATVIMFICNHCPYVVHINDKLVEISNYYIKKGISFIAINSNDIELYPADSPEKMIEQSAKYNYKFPYLFDSTQDVAKSYMAACTPDIFVFDGNMRLAYRGQFDSSRPNNGQVVDGKDLTLALDAILANEQVSLKQIPSIGCSIKWKSVAK
ncbi:MAG TPA: thioredoxin family protein [Candidatus Kapabacteria bacterium]|nr:thioredoxin family protein [Candidatus Kapabacteria bacterium]